MEAALLSAAFVFVGCGDDTSDAGGSGGSGAGGAGGAGGVADGAGNPGGESSTGGGGGEAGGPPAVPICGGTDFDYGDEDLGPGPDPEAGEFTLGEALAGLPEGDGPLRAIIETDLGSVTCEMFPEVAPNGVANFLGLARGTRPFKANNTWHKGIRFYDGLLFHRVIDDFVAQGGDPKGDGSGGPGYKFADEITGTKSHVPGTIAYANSGANTNGSQFYIVAEVPAEFLDEDYVIFGLCDPVSVVQALTEVPTDGPPEEGGEDRPLEDLHIVSVCVTRE